ncbi:hypothetical protein PSPO_b0548 [Pseudoalteromonas spongiae UST010723-006]|nr:hypothetical protein PSPO_b0548 [Pseudoalteromonas spongiae UST010723-006]
MGSSYFLVNHEQLLVTFSAGNLMFIPAYFLRKEGLRHLHEIENDS